MEIVKKTQQTSYLVKMVGDQSGGLIWVMNKVWQCVSKLAIIYGSEMFSLNPTQQLKLERIQRDLGRIMVRGKKGCAITAIYGELGWTDLSHDMAKRTLNFFGHLGSGTLDPGRWSQLAFLEGIEAVNRGVISPLKYYVDTKPRLRYL